jgi:Domain of unknown function (DUF5916)
LQAEKDSGYCKVAFFGISLLFINVVSMIPWSKLVVYRKKAIIVCLCILAATGIGFGQYEAKTLNAVRTEVAPKLDGKMDDICWLDAPIGSDFIMDKPSPGVPMPYQTEVRVVYNDVAVFVCIYNFDPSPDSIMKQMSGRDQDGNSDYCAVTISCYNDGVNGFTFATTPTGEQWDARETSNLGEDVSWNAIWDVRASVVADGWIAEYMIPFAALRFPESDQQVWSINFVREIRRTRQHAFWRGVDPLVSGYLTQMGTIEGINGVKAPPRIFLNPYASAYYVRSEDVTGKISDGLNYNGGLDLKLGLGPAFTLDATLIPDFGQTLSDQLILNLSAFDIQFTENRQFFIEGTDLFNKTGIFYSRRIGYDQPLGYQKADQNLQAGEEVIDNPAQDQVINAVKVTGRDVKGLGIGVFNGLTAPSFATLRNLESGAKRQVQTSNFTNYNAFVIDQNLPNNSYLNVMNTNVWRMGADYDANVTAFEFDLRNKKNSYSITGSGALNQKYGAGFDKYNAEEDRGFKSSIFMSKIDGQWTWSSGYVLESKYYDPNDLGFLQAPNSVGYWGEVNYNIYKPFGKFNNLWSQLSVNYNNLYEPYTFTDLNINGNIGLNTKKFFTFNIMYDGDPVRGYDYFEPRVEGRVFRTYRNHMVGGWISTDYRKRIAIDASSFYTRYENQGRFIFNWRLAPRFRFNDRLFVTYVYSSQNHYDDLGYAYAFEDEEGTAPLFGKRDVISHTNVLSVNYAFNPYMTLNTRVRHYWGYSKFSQFYSLQDDGYLSESENTSDNLNFNTFTVDMVFRWIFVPGSELTLVWKRAITDRAVTIPVNLIEDFDYTFRQPQLTRLPTNSKKDSNELVRFALGLGNGVTPFSNNLHFHFCSNLLHRFWATCRNGVGLHIAAKSLENRDS